MLSFIKSHYNDYKKKRNLQKKSKVEQFQNAENGKSLENLKSGEMNKADIKCDTVERKICHSKFNCNFSEHTNINSEISSIEAENTVYNSRSSDLKDLMNCNLKSEISSDTHKEEKCKLQKIPNDITPKINTNKERLGWGENVNKNMCFKKLNNVIETISNKMTYLENSFKARMDSMEQQINRLSSKSEGDEIALKCDSDVENRVLELKKDEQKHNEIIESLSEGISAWNKRLLAVEINYNHVKNGNYEQFEMHDELNNQIEHLENALYTETNYGS